MRKRKTAIDYEADIVALHQCLPDATVEKQIVYRVKKWMELAPVRIQVANNERTPWTSDMIGYQTESMPTKKSTGIRQTGDYHGVVATSVGDRYIDIVIERKALEDLYGTLVPEEERARFYREVGRFCADKRFNKMAILVEGSFTDFILYQPEFNADGFDYARRFDSKKNNTINEKKVTVLADLFVMGIPVIFCDNPTLAAQMCGRIMRESVRKNYAQLLGM